MTHISFSALKDWKLCPHRYKLLWVDRVEKFPGNEHTAFGSAIHAVLEYQLADKKPSNFKSWERTFDEEFIKAIKECYKKGAQTFKKDMIQDMRKKGKSLFPLAVPALKEKFGDFEVIGVETNLMEPIEGQEDFYWKGFIDLILKGEDEKIHVIDWKTCSSAFFWKNRTRTDSMMLYQLVYYKHFLCEKLEMNPKEVQVHFALLDWKAKKNRVQIFDTTSGPKRTKNALEILNKALHSTNTGFFPKNKLSCDKCFCQFKNTKWCP